MCLDSVRTLLKNINVNKATGPDGISGKLLKNCANSLAYPLSLLFRTSYNSGMVPQEWKLANVVPVYKKGGKASVENYRPISLTCLVMKIFEKIVRDELMTKCQHLLNSNQHGFLPSKSCTTQMIGFTESIAYSMNELMRTDVVYFDFAKAFDSVNHDIILNKLKNRFKIDGTLLKFIMNYLKDRQQCVIVNGQKSSLINVRSGVPQGSILGPLFFVIFIDDMINCVSSDTNIALYADDTKIWRKICSPEDHEILQSDIDALHQWSIRNKMKFHPNKCKVIPIAPPRRGLQDLFNKIFPLNNIFFYKLNGVELPYVEAEKDLGVHVTSNFSWNSQVEYLYSKASSRLGLLKRALHFVKCERQKRSFYLAIVRSQFEHCVQVWRPNSESMTDKLERIQRRAIKWILSEQDHSYSDVEYLMRLRDLDLLPMKYRFMFSDLVLFYDIYYEHSCIELPEHYKPYTNDDLRSRLRNIIRPPDYLNSNETLDLQNLRKTKNDELSLNCTIDVTSSIYKSSFFYRVVQDWNRLPSEVRSKENVDIFKESLIEYLKQQAFDFELEPD